MPHPGNHRGPGQAQVLRACLTYDFVVAMFGRSWGKTAMFPFLFWVEAGDERLRGQVYEMAYVGPYHDNARTEYRMMKRLLSAGGWLSDHMGMTGGHNDSELILHTRAFNGNLGAVIHFWGAENYDALRGHRKHRIVVDECKDIAEEAIFDVLLPMRLGRRGRFLFIGTPKRSGQGAGWFRDLFRRGTEKAWQAKGWLSFTAPSMANPWLTAEELQSLMDACPDEKTVREEIYAEIIEDDGAVFTRLGEAFSLPFAQPDAKIWLPQTPPTLHTWDRVFVGLDFGRKDDATVGTAMLHRTRSQLALMRLYRVPWPDQMAQIDRFHRLFAPAQVVMVGDERGLGEQITEELSRRYGEGFLRVAWNDDTKERDITAARFLFDEARWKFLAVPFQRSEFADYAIQSKDSKDQWLRRPKYGAPPNRHDDTVTAACLIAPHIARAFWSPDEEKPVPQIGSGQYHEDRIDKIAARRSAACDHLR